MRNQTKRKLITAIGESGAFVSLALAAYMGFKLSNLDRYNPLANNPVVQQYKQAQKEHDSLERARAALKADHKETSEGNKTIGANDYLAQVSYVPSTQPSLLSDTKTKVQEAYTSIDNLIQVTNADMVNLKKTPEYATYEKLSLEDHQYTLSHLLGYSSLAFAAFVITSNLRARYNKSNDEFII